MKNSQHGFTLIELIVVTTIIGVLAAIAIPQYNNYKIKSEKAVIVSDCNAIYRGFVVYFIENSEYPLLNADPDPGKVGLGRQFHRQTLNPLTNTHYMGLDLGLEINIKNLLQRIDGGQAEVFDSPDDTIGLNQEFYVVFPWAADPAVKFVIAQADDVKYADNTLVDGGNWLDGVYITKGGQAQ